MTPTLVVLQMQVNDSPLQPATAQAQMDGHLGSAWRAVNEILENHVGHLPLYVTSLNRQGTVGAWDVGKKQESLDWSSGRHLVGNPMVRFNMQGPLDASEQIIVVGDDSFRHIARTIIRDIDFGRGIVEFNAALRNVRSPQACGFKYMLRGLMSEGDREQRARLYQQMDFLHAMYDGRLPREANEVLDETARRLAELTNTDLEDVE